jgi:hypothetical protein
LRRIVPPNVKLIEWGHKVSFAYISGEITEADYSHLAEHITKTDGLLCSSCQGVYIDTENPKTAEKFCEEFLPYLRDFAAEKSYGVGITARRTLYLENEKFAGKKIWKAENCGIVIQNGTDLESGSGFSCIWVKMLPKTEIIKVLKPYKNRLQTVGLICPPSCRNELSELLYTAGATTVTNSEMNPSTITHDGEFALRRYVRVCF